MHPRTLALTLLALVACGDDSSSSSTDDEGLVIRFALPDSGRPQPLAVPFPSDIYKDSDGTLVDDMTDWTLIGVEDAQPSAVFAQLGAYDGFGTQGGVLFSVAGIPDDAAFDPASLGADSAVLVDVESGTRLPCSVGWDDYARVITVLPDDTLATGRTYAAALLRGPALAGGQAIDASSAFARLRDGSGGRGDAALYTQAIDAVVAAGAARGDVIAATLYTTATPQPRLQATVDRLYAGAYGAAPALNLSPAAPIRATRFGTTAHGGWTATLDELLGTPLLDTMSREVPGFAGTPGGREPAGRGVAHDKIAAVLNGSIASPQFVRPFTGTAGYEDGTIEYTASGDAVVADPDAQIPVTIVLPKGPIPTGGFPVVMVQHGLGGDRTVALAIANELAGAGYATVAIDSFLHGVRDPELGDAGSPLPGSFDGPDGFADSSNAQVILRLVGEFKNLLRMRDVTWQFTFDLVALRRMIDTVDLGVAAVEYAGTTPTLDASQVAIIGWSLGGVMTNQFASVTPTASVNPVVLTSPASNFAVLFGESPVYAEQSVLLAGAAGLRTASVDAGAYAAALQMIEHVALAADTGAYAPHTAQKHDVWVLAAEQDESVPYRSLDQLLRSLGATQVTPAQRTVSGLAQAASPYMPSGRTAAFFEVAPGNHGHTFDRYATLRYEPPYPRTDGPRFVSLAEPLFVRQPVVGEQRAIAAFIGSVFAGTPRIDVTSAMFPGLRPVHDLDDDGSCDMQEIAGGANPADPGSRPAGTGGCERELGFGQSAL